MLKQIIVFATLLFFAQTGFSQGHYLKGALSYGIQKNPNFYFSKAFNTTVADYDDYLPNYFYQLGYVKETPNKSVDFLVGGRPGFWQSLYDTDLPTTKLGHVLTGNVHFQVERKRIKCFDEKRKSSAYFGTFYNLGYDYHHFRTAYNTFYSSTARTAKAKMGIVPGTRIGYGKRLVVDLNVAISLISIGLESRRVENPALSERAQKSSTFKMDLPMEAILRVGIAYRI